MIHVWTDSSFYASHGGSLAARCPAHVPAAKIPILPPKSELQTRAVLNRRCPRSTAQDLLNNLFRHPYTKIEALQTAFRCHA